MEDPANELHLVAPTLEELKKLPIEHAARMLLVRLVKIRSQQSDGLNKRNLLLPPDHYQLGNGYPQYENMAVRQFLLGSPWAWLESQEYLIDVAGNGFFDISEDGHEYLRKGRIEVRRSQPSVSTVPVTLPDRIEGVPRVFISYSWEGDEHKAWVRALAERLQNDGIQVIFDRWYLKLGQDKLHFMERAVADSDYVAVVCTENYAKRANEREGGVGWESMIITSEVAEHMLTDKFIPVLRQGSFGTSLPRYLKSRLGVDLKGDPINESDYEELVRKFHGEPVSPPPIGMKPDFIKAAPKPSQQVAGSTREAPQPLRIPVQLSVGSPTLTSEDKRLLSATASDPNGRVMAVETLDGFSVWTNGENFAEDTPRSVATWKRTLRRLVDNGYLVQLSDEVYEMTQDGFDRADIEQAATPLSISLSFEGDVDNQSLSIKANKPIKVKSVDLLTSSEVSIATIGVEGTTTEKTSVPMAHEKVVILFNAPRPDKNGWDHSGPAALRVVFEFAGRASDVVLPILLQPAMKDHTQWIKLTGSKNFTVGGGESSVHHKVKESWLLDSLRERPNATLYAHYEKPGTPGRLHAVIRQWDEQGVTRYSFESDRGDEFVGSKKDAITSFYLFNRGLIGEGYKRMNFMPGADAEFQGL